MLFKKAKTHMCKLRIEYSKTRSRPARYNSPCLSLILNLSSKAHGAFFDGAAPFKLNQLSSWVLSRCLGLASPLDYYVPLGPVERALSYIVGIPLSR